VLHGVGRFHHLTGHEVTEGEVRYSPTLFLDHGTERG
jgi:hypothetical protein